VMTPAPYFVAQCKTQRCRWTMSSYAQRAAAVVSCLMTMMMKK
jgi:hypothetical protein